MWNPSPAMTQGALRPWFRFYDEAKTCYCVLQSGETSIYANIILQKGVVK